MATKVQWTQVLVCAFLIFGDTKLVWSQSAVDVGKKEYITSCAPCHGITGKGDGLIAKSFHSPPTDLTKLSDGNNGALPILRIYYTIHGATQTDAHGSREMPVWGNVFSRQLKYPGSTLSDTEIKSMVDERILALIEYISTLQSK